MFKKWIFVFFFTLAVLAVGYIISSGSYPIALVNWKSISLRDFNDARQISIHYYEKADEVYNRGGQNVFSNEQVRSQVDRAVFEKLIVDDLIDQELLRRMKANELKDVINKKISEVLTDPNIGKGVAFVYGLSLENFKEKVLWPQAKMEILEGQMFLENNDFSEWLKEEKGKASVSIFLPGYKWDGENIIRN